MPSTTHNRRVTASRSAARGVALDATRAAIALAIAGAITLVSCGEARTGAVAMDPQGHAGRSSCLGSAPVSVPATTGEAADAVEELSATYGERPGFLAVVFDGVKPIVIVEASRFASSLAELYPAGVAVASSCVDVALLAAVLQTLPDLPPTGTAASAGYDGLTDSINVIGIDPDALTGGLEARTTRMGERAKRAIRAGTLRVSAAPFNGGR